jgi:hypothetical protein
MKTPTQIKYHGHIYVQAARELFDHPNPHKRCPVGQHWNDKQHKCLPLPAELAKVSQQAFKASNRASRSSDDSLRDAVHHVAATGAHGSASRYHKQAAQIATKHGFKDVARQHSNSMNFHEQMSKLHGEKADAYFKGFE